ncbi:UDP-glucose--hexose-1-phosphate uridylyltransferase [Paenilisteria rocourtiae]|uniref:Galactose-1-phosphate uridylyltransferase n=1 Tax=Listeria rocourtiae TaxID=647910 RepID=A0A4R6ZJG0_9LIST|nr:UDP-glucose--hexose-1-phosphate uridylyltransferase [Listeria rocourtiae]EUJ52186.1 galactose-1-phosphate uridylyltransferase [Listeria rocourtiae FSL F6-920]MBC1433841.1 UDP-glucose--hexose-1-phosphate uridylyltransferase [Listeria rocourtiae]MBC1605016.1 UDP-glucose--hexose-1-phosphate uridylyltransferase [Listeria rocourtiae]TDR52408.1 UTP-hexose-1-phosphate uridylyltransferase [Listeria rocourtiae]
MIVDQFVDVAIKNGELAELDRIYITNRLLDLLGWSEKRAVAVNAAADRLEMLDQLTELAVESGVIGTVLAEREIWQSKVMDLFVPSPSDLNAEFWELYERSPRAATDYFYKISCASDYIKTRSIAKNIEYRVETAYGELEMTINLSKPEKDPKQIALEKMMKTVAYPVCALCVENEGYAGRMDFPARTNHRIVRMRVGDEEWGLQYSPYAYYEEHCIFLSAEHRPMVIERDTFARLVAITAQFPDYFVGSNADLPIVGGSILSHDHYQGGGHTFAMAKAPVHKDFPTYSWATFPNVTIEIVKWPMSVIRLRSASMTEIVEAADVLMQKWKNYSDASVEVLAYSGEERHNTITPIASRCDSLFELSLVLRNNRRTTEHPDGLFHPHQELHHIKKENIGLIEVMGLAVLPPRLKPELEEVALYLLDQPNKMADYHREWADRLKREGMFDAETVEHFLQQEVGKVFMQVLTDAGVFKDTPDGIRAFDRFMRLVIETEELENEDK